MILLTGAEKAGIARCVQASPGKGSSGKLVRFLWPFQKAKGLAFSAKHCLLRLMVTSCETLVTGEGLV